MPKGPPPPVRPKPKNLSEAPPATPLKPTSRHSGTTIDEIISTPITMDAYPESEAESAEEDETETPRLSPIPVTPSRQSRSVGTETNVLSPFKPGVEVKTGKYPLPPQRNVLFNTTASPLRKVSQDLGLEHDFAEGMRSPLKSQVNASSSRSSTGGYIPPPPPKRNLRTTPVVNDPTEGSDTDEETSLARPSLPPRRSKGNAKVPVSTDSDGSPPPPTLPERRNARRSLSPQLFPDSDIEHEYEDELEEDRSVHVGNAPPLRQYKGNPVRSNTPDYPSRINRESSSNQLLNQAKTFSKDSYILAREKSAPYLNKMKDKIKNKMNNGSSSSLDVSKHSDIDDSVYRSQTRSHDETYAKGHNETDDNVTPSLPARRVGVPLPGLTNDDDLKPPHKVKPPIPTKSKPVVAPKKSSLLPPSAPVSRSRSPSTSISSNKSASMTTSTTAAPPPPPPSRSRPAAPPPRSSSTWKEPTLNLQLKSLWFTEDDELPNDLRNLNYQCSHGFVGPKEFKVYAFRLDDLSTLRLKLVWKTGSPAIFEEDVSFIPPPTVTKKLLTEGHEKYGEHVANWCEAKEGMTVGNGECWTLAHDALERASGKYAFTSSGLNHGALLATYTGSGITTPVVTDELRRGDILQFKSCVFEYPYRTMTFGAPDHTAVVLDVKPGEDSARDERLKWVEIIHQNLGGVKKVRVSEIDLGKLKSGEMRAFRPVDCTWIKSLSSVVV